MPQEVERACRRRQGSAITAADLSIICMPSHEKRYTYDFGPGMQVEQTIEIEKMGSDFWDSMQDA